MNKKYKKAPLSSFDVIYLSYDEPNAEGNWADLINKVPWAKRVHGIKGFDEAHKQCAYKSGTENFITVDGDNKIDPTFFDCDDFIYNPDIVYSWKGKNYINDLIYGNGGLKLWPKHLVLNMRTHEHSDDRKGIEFCWDLSYNQMHDCYSTSYNNVSPFQAFRVGFREGVKLSLHNGKKVSSLTEIWPENRRRLIVWMTVGGDVENGIYAIFGARLGCYLTNLTEFDISAIADYDWFNEKWHNEWLFLIENEERFVEEYRRLAVELRENLELPLVNYGAGQSRLYKEIALKPKQLGPTVSEAKANKLLMNLR